MITAKILQHMQEKGEYVAALKARGPPLGLLEGIEDAF